MPKSLLLCVSGGIAAYKSCEIARHFVKLGVQVNTVLTENAARFVSPLTFESLTNRPCFTGMFKDKDISEPGGAYRHIDLGKDFNVMLVAPATANVIAKFAAGIADDLLTTTFLCAERKVIIAPAMNTRMWNHPATQRNLKRIIEDGVQIISPGAGDLACGEFGEGRLADVNRICSDVEKALGAGGHWSGRSVLVTTGPTRENVDPVRFVSNNSTGEFGRCVARQLIHYGAEVTLIEANPNRTSSFDLSCRKISVKSASEMASKALEFAAGSDYVFMLSAVADYAPASPSPGKIKKTGSQKLTIELNRTADVLSELSKLDNRPLLVGVSVETENVVENSKAKLESKGLEAIFAVELTGNNLPFGDSPLSGTLIGKSGNEVRLESGSKDIIARHFVDFVLEPPADGG